MNTTFEVTRTLQYERKVKLLRRVLIALPVIYTAFGVFYLTDGLIYSALSNFIYSLLALACLAFLKPATCRVVVLIYVSAISLETLFQSWVLDPGMGVPYVFLVIYPFIFLLSTFSDKWDILFLLTVNSLAFMASGFQIEFFNSLQEVNPEIVEENRRFTVIFATVMLVGALYLLSRSNWRFEVGMMENQLKLDSIYNSTSDANLLVAKDGTILSLNETARTFLHQLLGPTIREGHRLVDILPEEIRQHFQLRFPEIIETPGRPITGSATLRDGEVRWIEQRAYSVKDHRGDPWAISFNLRDVTAEHQLEEEKRARDILLNSINQNIRDGVYRVCDQTSIVYANNAFLRIFGYESMDDLREIEIRQLYKHKQDRELFINQLTGRGRVESMEIEFLRADGTSFWGAISAIRTKDHLGQEVFDGSIRDITELKDARDGLIRAKDQAEAASRAKAEFLSTMSHEIRTPMNAVIGMTDILLMENPRENQEDNLNILKFSANHLLRIINDILDLSKIDSGKIDIEVTEVSIKELLKSIITAFEPKAKSKHLDLRFNLDSDIPDVVLTDPTRVNQVLTNLLGNAIKFTETGHVAISAELEHLEDKRARVRFAVEDTGIGIAPENREKIFDQFQQEHSYTTRKYGGTGLGLTIVKRLLELLEGEIKVESEIGKGSTFYFTLEVDVPKRIIRDKDALEDAIQKPKDQLKSFTNLKVLLVEDNLINIKITCKFLEKWGVITHVAENGREAVDQAKEHDYDLILMDLQMPVMDGYQAATEIRQFNKAVPIVALTASAMLEVKEQVYDHGMDGFLTKPIIPTDFNRMLAEHAGEDKVMSDH